MTTDWNQQTADENRRLKQRAVDLRKRRDELADAYAKMKVERDAAVAMVKSLMSAVRPVVEFSDSTIFRSMPDDIPITMGSSMARRQIVASDFKEIHRVYQSVFRDARFPLDD